MSTITEHVWVKGDLAPALFYQLDPIEDLTGLTVTFSMWDVATKTLKIAAAAAVVADGSYLINGVVTAYTPADGVVYYEPSGTDTDTIDDYRGQFTITFPGPKPGTYPARAGEFINIRVTEKIE